MQSPTGDVTDTPIRRVMRHYVDFASRKGCIVTASGGDTDKDFESVGLMLPVSWHHDEEESKR